MCVIMIILYVHVHIYMKSLISHDCLYISPWSMIVCVYMYSDVYICVWLWLLCIYMWIYTWNRWYLVTAFTFSPWSIIVCVYMYREVYICVWLWLFCIYMFIYTWNHWYLVSAFTFPPGLKLPVGTYMAINVYVCDYECCVWYVCNCNYVILYDIYATIIIVIIITDHIYMK